MSNQQALAPKNNVTAKQEVKQSANNMQHSLSALSEKHLLKGKLLDPVRNGLNSGDRNIPDAVMNASKVNGSKKLASCSKLMTKSNFFTLYFD